MHKNTSTFSQKSASHDAKKPSIFDNLFFSPQWSSFTKSEWFKKNEPLKTRKSFISLSGLE